MMAVSSVVCQTANRVRMLTPASPSRSAGQDFATRIGNVFVIGRGDKPLISLPKGKGEHVTVCLLSALYCIELLCC